jgi:alpha-D-ribose 1-methylphosphonate 5-triphosphate synthase subunit PhnH
MQIEIDILRQQANFRVLLTAMSRPGLVFHLAALSDNAVSPALMAVAECLLDGEVTFATVPDKAGWALQQAIQITTGSQPGAVSRADFVFVHGACSQGAARLARRGRLEFADEGATLVYLTTSLSAKQPYPLPVRFKGPGIARDDGLAPAMAGLSIAELSELSRINADYPLGVDALFVHPTGALMALPRSTRITLE